MRYVCLVCASSFRVSILTSLHRFPLFLLSPPLQPSINITVS